MKINLNLPNWYLLDNFTQNERYEIATADAYVEFETEKAELICWCTEYGTIKKWIPKSIINDTYNKQIECKAIWKDQIVGIVEKGEVISQLENGKWISNNFLKFI